MKNDIIQKFLKFQTSTSDDFRHNFKILYCDNKYILSKYKYILSHETDYTTMGILFHKNKNNSFHTIYKVDGVFRMRLYTANKNILSHYDRDFVDKITRTLKLNNKIWSIIINEKIYYEN
jgi:hypothetical protein